MTTDNKSFIDGSWYEQQYSTPGERYHEMYTGEIPQWAKDANAFHVQQVLAWLTGFAVDSVLEVGCGVGNYQTAWKNALVRGDVCVVDVSESAARIARSRGHSVDVGRAGALEGCPLWDDHPGFDLVFTAAVMEHIDVSVTNAALIEFAVFAPLQAHYIPLEKGDDPSHIHVQPVEAWVAEFKKALPSHRVYVVDNALDRTQPLYILAEVSEKNSVFVLDHGALRGAVRRFQ